MDASLNKVNTLLTKIGGLGDDLHTEGIIATFTPLGKLGEQCKHLTDDQVLEMRDSMYPIAENLLDVIIKEAKEKRLKEKALKKESEKGQTG